MRAILIALALISSAQAEENYNVLSYRVNENAVLFISNAPCQHKDLIKRFPNAAAAVRVDHLALSGCFTNVGDNIVIQWDKGDISIIPANLFLMGR